MRQVNHDGDSFESMRDAEEPMTDEAIDREEDFCFWMFLFIVIALSVLAGYVAGRI